MALVDAARLQDRANTDPEFRIAARYWNATLCLESSFESSSDGRSRGARSLARTDAFRVEIADGQVTRCGQAPTGHAAPAEAATITIAATDEGWGEFLAAAPRPYYQDLLGGCVQHHGFAVGGDVLSLAAYYQALQRLFAIMREVRADMGRR